MTQEKINEIKKQNDGAIVLVREEKVYTLYGADARTLLYDVMDGCDDMLYAVYEDEQKMRLSSVSFRIERLAQFRSLLISEGYKVFTVDNMTATEEHASNQDVDAKDELIRQTAYLLIRKADENVDEEMYFQAVLLIGRSECIRYKFDNNLELDKQDKEYIRDRI